MTAAQIPDALRPRLGAIVRRLASDQPGEVVAAAAALRRTLATAGADLNDLGDTIERPPERAVYIEPAQTQRRKRRGPETAPTFAFDEVRARRIADALTGARARGVLTPWEEEFTASVLPILRGCAPRLSARQVQVVERLMRKVEMSR